MVLGVHLKIFLFSLWRHFWFSAQLQVLVRVVICKSACAKYHKGFLSLKLSEENTSRGKLNNVSFVLI